MLEAAIALLLVIAYWGYVVSNVFRVKREAGKAPSLTPGTKEEKVLQLGWQMIVAGQLIQPLAVLLIRDPWWLFRPAPGLDAGWLSVMGGLLMIAGLLGTRWSYLAMGRHWSMWIDREQPGVLIQSGPYRWVRHPIYAFQILVSVGLCCLLSTPFLLCVVGLNLACIWKKVQAEENHLLDAHQDDYRAYMARTGRFFPRF